MASSFLHHSQSIRHGLGRLSLSRDSSPHPQPDIISSLKPTEEETLPKYNKNDFYPVKFGEVLNDRYQVVLKLGYGITATVWLAKDLHASPRNRERKYVAIKVNVNTVTDSWTKGCGGIVDRLTSQNPKHEGYNHVRLVLDSFKIKGPHGHHVCLVFEVLREPIGECMEKWPSHLFSSDNLRKLVPALLKGLDYLHSECRVVHTDLKPDNIMMGLGGSSVLEKVVQNEIDHPSPRKMPDSHGRIIYQSRSDFGDAPNEAIIESAKITDMGLAVWGDEPHKGPIQSNAFTAPEVILTAGWSYPADIWNLGVMLWDLFENFGLFDDIDTRPSHYHPAQHLGLMIALMGPPPRALLKRGSTTATYFDENGEFRYPKFVPRRFSFESTITRFRGTDKELAIDFAKKMVCWLPEERWTARQLLGHPWLTERTPEEILAERTGTAPAPAAPADPAPPTPPAPDDPAPPDPAAPAAPAPTADPAPASTTGGVVCSAVAAVTAVTKTVVGSITTTTTTNNPSISRSNSAIGDLHSNSAGSNAVSQDLISAILHRKT